MKPRSNREKRGKKNNTGNEARSKGEREGETKRERVIKGTCRREMVNLKEKI